MEHPVLFADTEGSYGTFTMINVAQDKTVIFISQTLSTTIMADRIYMFEQGEVKKEAIQELWIKRKICRDVQSTR